MKSQIDKVKIHVKRNQTYYICLGYTVFVAGFTALIMKDIYDAKHTYCTHQPLKSTPTVHSGLSFYDSPVSNSFNVVNVIERESRGHPGYLTRCIETGLTWVSQKQAAIDNGVHPNRMSDHLHGLLENLDGKHYERIFMVDSQ